uniref:Uncharacterized protein n=1 Tax=Micrurus surinamensis TaxID=129470 RepID=A0A2D4PT21_MICSU
MAFFFTFLYVLIYIPLSVLPLTIPCDCVLLLKSTLLYKNVSLLTRHKEVLGTEYSQNSSALSCVSGGNVTKFRTEREVRSQRERKVRRQREGEQFKQTMAGTS